MPPPVESKPNPDPSTLTTAQLDKGLEALEKLLSARIHCSEDNVAKMEGFLGLRQDAIDKTVRHLQDLQDEKFKGVEKQFTERDTRADKIAELNQKAIDAAFQAAKASVETQNTSNAQASAKSEAAIAKQIDAMMMNNATANKASDDKIEDLKTRLGALDTKLSTITGHSRGIGDGWGLIAGGIGALSGAVAIIIAITSVRADKPSTSAVAPQVVFVPSPPATMPSQPATR